MRFKETIKVTWLPVVAASLCCLSPLILVLLGLSTISFAASLSNTLYGEYRWTFRLAGLVLLALTTFFYLRRAKGICTLSEAKKRKREVINTILVVVIAGVVGYVIFLYGVVEFAGILLGIWKL